MAAVPAETPVTKPLAVLIVIVDAGLLHAPPKDGSLSEMDEPTQTADGPTIADGVLNTDSCVVV